MTRHNMTEPNHQTGDQPVTYPQTPPAWLAPPPPPASHRKKRHTVRYVLLGALVLIVAVIVAAGLSDAGKVAAPILPASPPATVAAAPTAPASTPDTLYTWWTDGARPLWDRVTVDLYSIGADTDETSRVADCTSLNTDAQTMLDYTPAPDPVVASEMGQALPLLTQAAQACVVGNDATSNELAMQATTHIQAAVTRIQTLTR